MSGPDWPDPKVLCCPDHLKRKSCVWQGVRPSGNNWWVGMGVRTGEGMRMPGGSDPEWTLRPKSFSLGLRLLWPSSFGSNDLAIVFILERSSTCREEELKFISLVRGHHVRACFTHLRETVSPLC